MHLEKATSHLMESVSTRLSTTMTIVTALRRSGVSWQARKELRNSCDVRMCQ